MTEDPSSLVWDGYDAIAARYLAQRNKFKSLPYLEKLASLLELNSLVLDLGCGAGDPVDTYLAEKGHRILGLDISTTQVDLARKLLPTHTFQVRDMATLEGGEFLADAIVSFYAIFHIPREAHAGLFRILRTFLRPGGFILVTMGNSDWEAVEPDFHGVPMYWSHFGRVKNAKLIHDAGFEILSDDADSSSPGETHQVVLARAKPAKVHGEVDWGRPIGREVW